ncbi:MAG TPA: hypothetical protein VN873_01390 [Candidatus Angelobacter sp.]|nr:hypothetical protein [Candidatus Angelobacter sp.]
MKKILLRVCIALVALIIIAALAVHFFLDSAVKRGVETIGPKLTKVDVKLDGVHLSLLSGAGSIKGLAVGNPEPYKSPHSITVGTASLALQPGSLFADKVIIKSIDVESPEITFEGGLTGNNLKKIEDNINAATSGPHGTNVANATPKEQKKANRKLEVDDFKITGAKLTATLTDLGGKTITIPLPTIELQNLGTGPDGITPAELTKKVLSEIEKKSVEAVSSSAGNLGNLAGSLTKGLGTNTSGSVSNITRGLGKFFRRK